MYYLNIFSFIINILIYIEVVLTPRDIVNFRANNIIDLKSHEF